MTRHLAPARRDPSDAGRLGGRRPRLDQRGAGQRARRARRASLCVGGERIEFGSTEAVFELCMNSLEPVSVALKFGFLAVLYLFLLWVARSARRDLGGSASSQQTLAPPAPDATGMYSASTLGSAGFVSRAPRLVVERAPGHEEGMIYDLDGDLILGRGDPLRSASRTRSRRPGTPASMNRATASS